ncbi:hypothetical protein RMSM_05072 [Rhodopirellula maiorica SM1]|uniref:Uncharacterized protein n=1 Tax=Rhodopirellula maiorica SM1 TaxID=1265738 RepID=M5RF67_9BACT|nr:hypothetical protein [Rhodopirellula maiorica]EMI18005.1 hypothetical protein RMSM_05072 [Rhodopirellula maiorica SM1]
MWKTGELGLATWSDASTTWQLDATGGPQGIQLGLAGGDPKRVQFVSVGEDVFPQATEQFVRGDELHVSFPQQEGSYSIEAVFKPITSSAKRLVIEVVLSLETRLLDTHPTVDLVAAGSRDASSVSDPSPSAGCDPISQAIAGDISVAVLLGPHDAPFTANQSSADQLRLRLFGEFLEKGVIRKARPWIVLSTSDADAADTGVTSDELKAMYAKLCASPLPLTP